MDRPGAAVRVQAVAGWVLFVALAGCGPSTAQVKTAREARYQADAAVVFNAVQEAVKSQYKLIKVADGARGVIETDWTLVEKVSESGNASGQTSSADARQGGIVFRLRVELTSAAPFAITIDGEAAEVRPGMVMIQPWKHGDPGEPGWVQGRIDEMYVAIYERLKQHAVK